MTNAQLPTHVSMFSAAGTGYTNCGLALLAVETASDGGRVAGYAAHATCPDCIATVKAIKAARKAASR